MAALDIISTGTVTATNGSATVTGTSTTFATSLVTGGTLYVAGLSALIESVESETSLTLRRAWPGTTAADSAYDIQRQRAEAASTVIANDRLANLIAKLAAGTLFRPDAIGTFAGRDAYDDAAEAFVYAVPGAVSGGAPTYYIKLSGDDADWSAGQTTDGVAATIAVGTVTTLAAGESATVENVGTPAAAVLDIGIPAGDDGDDGDDGEMAAATYDPNAVADDAFDMDNMAEGATTKIMTADERTKLSTLDETSDLDKPISSAAQDALDLKADKLVSINAQTGTSYTAVIGDLGKDVTMDNASANTFTIPTNASVAFAVGATMNVVQIGAGVTTIEGDTGVTVNGVSAGSGDLTDQYQGVTLLKIATDTWIASGAIGAVS